MDEATAHEVRQWLHKADHDLRSAARLMSGGEEALLDTAVYHCQQAAEKALKAYLTAHGVVFPKIHLLLPLLALCADIDSSFSQLTDAAEFLTPFATEFRYPGDILEPEPADAEDAYNLAKRVVNFVESRLM
ncbi:MAG: HEPN domain-containing protein [Thermodesulfobacteriota bacterium]